MATTKKTATKTRRKKKMLPLVDYHFEGQSYVLDLNRDRVYRNWMAIETNKGVSIIGAYKQGLAASA